MSPMIRWMVLALAWWGPVLAQDWGLTQSQTLTAGRGQGVALHPKPEGRGGQGPVGEAYPSSTGISSGRGIG